MSHPRSPLLSNIATGRSESLVSIDLNEEEPVQPAPVIEGNWCSRHCLAIVGFIALFLGTGLAITAWKLTESPADIGTPDTPPDEPLLFCPTYDVAVFQDLTQHVVPFTYPTYTLKNNCDIRTPLEKQFADAHYGLLCKEIGNMTIAIFHVLGETPQQICERAYHFTLVSGYQPQGQLVTLPDSTETACLYNNITRFSPTSPWYITETCEKIAMLAVRTTTNSICQSALFGKRKEASVTPYVTAAGSTVTTRQNSAEEKKQTGTRHKTLSSL